MPPRKQSASAKTTRSSSKAPVSKSKAAPVKKPIAKKAQKIQAKAATRGRQAASPSPSVISKSSRSTSVKQVPVKSASKAKSVSSVKTPAKNAVQAKSPAPKGKAAAQKAAPVVVAQKGKRGRSPAPSPAVVVPPAPINSKRKGKDLSLTPATKVAAKASPVKKVKVDVEPPKIQKLIVKGLCAVDQFVTNSSQFTVLQVGQTIYNFALNQSNVDANNNKFYVGQVLQKDGTNLFYTFFRWGRVGVPGQNSFVGHTDQMQAISDFTKKKNAKISGGYTEIFLKYGEDDDDNKKPTKAANTSTKKKSCTLSAPIQTLINEIFDMKMIENSIKEIGYDSKKMPLGKLDDKTVKSAYTVLTQLLNAVKNNKANEYGPLSSKFYSLIPHDFGFQKMSNFILKSEEQVKVKLQMLQDLSDLKIATQLLKQSDSDDSLIDQNYKKLNTEIKEVTDKKERDIILEYINQGKNYYNPKVLEIYSVKRKGEKERYAKKIGNDTLLWHGSRISNFVGILSQGLRIAPPEAPSTGYNYGKGIYLADQFAKSCDYCQGNTDGVNYIMLIKAALGKPNRIEKTDYNASNLPAGTNSCWGWGTEGPADFLTFNGVKIPKGKPTKTKSKHWMQYNEFIIYDIAQAEIDYLIRYKKY